jgi:hypothetical protein
MKIFAYLIGFLSAFPSVGTSSGMYSYRVRNHFKMNKRFSKTKGRMSKKQVVLPDVQFFAKLRNIRNKTKGNLRKLQEEIKQWNKN